MSYTRSFSSRHDFRIALRRGTFAPTLTHGVTLTGTRTGTKKDNWRELIRNGLSATTPYSLDRKLLSDVVTGVAGFAGTQISAPPPGVPRASYSESWSGVEILPNNNAVHLTTDTAKAEAIALQKIYSKIRAEQQHLNSPAVLAEFADVLRQFGSPMRSIIDLTNRRLNRLALERRGLKGSTIFKRQKWSEIVASTYLEYAFGLAPLISDTRSAAEALARWQYETTGEARHRKAIMARGLASAVSKTTGDPTRAWNSQWIYVRHITQRETERRVQYNVGLSTSVLADYGSNERLLQLLGFTPHNWIPALYEAVPWSWLLDYFTNVQQILEASVTNVSGVTWISKTVVDRTETKYAAVVDARTSSDAARSNNISGAATGHCGSWKYVRTTMTRTIPTSLGIPPLYTELPSSVGKLANMAAVLLSKKPSSSALWLF